MSTANKQRKTRIKMADETARSAVEVDTDLAVIEVSPRAFQAFLARMDMPPQANDRLRKTMRTPSPWSEPVPFKE